MSKEHVRVWREKQLANDLCPDCHNIKLGKDVDYHYCKSCRKIRSDAQVKRLHKIKGNDIDRRYKSNVGYEARGSS